MVTEFKLSHKIISDTKIMADIHISMLRQRKCMLLWFALDRTMKPYVMIKEGGFRVTGT